MSLLKIAEGADPNYLATIVKITKILPHPNAERLELTEVFGNTIVIGKGSYSEGDVVCYFPVESVISNRFLSWANLLSKPELNADQKSKGFFESKSSGGRVKAIGLRSIPSQGFLFKVSELARYYGVDESVFKIGETFNMVGEDTLLTKYIKGDSKVSGEANTKKSRVPNWINFTVGLLPRPIRRPIYLFINAWFNRNAEGIKSSVVEGQFKFHYKTEHLGRNVHIIKPDDFITVTSKWHGTSAIYSNILCKKAFNPIRSIGNALGFKSPTEEYKFVYASRSLFKNRRDGKFTDDVWGIIASELEDSVPETFSVYGEIVGYTPSGKTIQKDYNYGVPTKHCEFRVYRITQNTDEGVKELEWYEIEEFCYEHGLKTVPVYYNGTAQDLFPEIPLDANWNDNFLSSLKNTYLDVPCEFCTTGVVNEGIVLRIENSPNKTALKFKSPKFLIKESADRDNEESNIDEDN